MVYMLAYGVQPLHVLPSIYLSIYLSITNKRNYVGKVQSEDYLGVTQTSDGVNTVRRKLAKLTKHWG